ncbi:MAG: hypothetical protein Q8J78_04910 [Moraxellaceae bacterium]|nr:hypothetical protein [Moraxellaceae bacterium]
MISLDQWRALEPGQQVDMWLAVPDGQQQLYLESAHPIASIVLRCIPAFTGDTAGDRSKIKQALERGDWMKHGLIIADLRDNNDRLTGLVERMHWAPIAKQNWEQGLEESVLEMWPAARLVATVGRIKPGTKERWIAAGGQLFGGRMIALKTSAVWSRFSMFGRPHPPYDNFSHQLDVEDVEYSSARRLKLLEQIARNTRPPASPGGAAKPAGSAPNYMKDDSKSPVVTVLVLLGAICVVLLIAAVANKK